MKTIAENANDFADLRTLGKGDCIYVDKTDYFHRLVTASGARLFFIACPRRFGKSLMITTFKAIFEGKRELFRGLKIDATDVTDLGNLSPLGMLYQAGYLTIADYSQGIYQLRVPDEEVKRDIAALQAGAWADRDARWSVSLGVKLRTGKWDDFFDGLKALYARLPYGAHESGERKNEFSYQRPLCALLAAQGFRYDPEVTQTGGRSDLIAEHPSGVWIFELKVDQSADAALRQIHEKDYAAPYRVRNLPIWAIGLNFDSKTRKLTDADYERL